MTVPKPQRRREQVARSPEPFAPSELKAPFRPRDEAELWLYGLERLGIRPGLERTRELLDAIGNPQRRVPAYVVAGTNGKGTVTHLLGDRLRSLGLRVGVYTSPHLLDICERATVVGLLPREELSSRVAKLRPHVERIGATFFETFTVLALDWFADEGVDCAVLEVGVGGRWDATNVSDKRAVLLCSIGADHMELLGPTLADIAREKLALASAGVPFYFAPLSSELHELALREIQSRDGIAIAGAQLPACAGEAERAAQFQSDTQRQLSRFVDRCLLDLARRGQLALSVERLVAGRVPARFELYGRTPPLLFDPAHNEPALHRLLETAGPGGPHDVLVFAQMRDKRLAEVLPSLHAAAPRIVVTAPHWHRSHDPWQLAAQLSACGASRVECRPRVVDALEHARQLAVAGRVLVTGSNFLVAEALDRIGVDELFADAAAPLWDSGRPLRRREGED